LLFSLNQLTELQAFDPEVISCYPNIARELYRNSELSFPSLKAFKLGGEAVLEVDLELLKSALAILRSSSKLALPKCQR